ncbi:hypothetical protein KI387_030124, partial [Taxus chinensis]
MPQRVEVIVGERHRRESDNMAEERLEALSEQCLQYSLILSAVCAALCGYYTWSFKTMLVTYATCLLCSLLLLIPDWSFFTRHPSHWGFPMASDKQTAIAHKPTFQFLNNSSNYAQRFNFYPLRMIG